MNKKFTKFLSASLAAALIFSSFKTVAFAENGTSFKKVLPEAVKRPVSTQKFVAKPLIILMDFPDYKYTELDKKETDFRINSFKGAETTPEFYKSFFFGDDFYKTEDGKENITLNKYYQEVTNGGYALKGDVFGWYTTKENAKAYGEASKDQNLCKGKLLKEAMDELIKNNPKLDLRQYDVEDRYDLDGDGNYNEPDGIIDCLVVIHAGIGEEWGGGSLKTDAIWPFRWGHEFYKADYTTVKEKQEAFSKDPEYTDAIGNKLRLEDFLVFEQDLPLDLFAHEFGHNLGLPDLYGTGSNTPPVENWSLMGGSYTGVPRGSTINSYGAYCNQELQKSFNKMGRSYAAWQDQQVVDLKDITPEGMDVVLDQTSIKGQNKNCIRINLPDRATRTITPPEGKLAYFAGKTDNLLNDMITKDTLDLTNAKKAELTFKTWYNIDPEYDYASVQVQVQGESTWTSIAGNITTTENPNKDELERNPGNGITFDSGNKWVDAKFDLSAYAGKKISLKFHWFTDTNTPMDGIYFDQINITADGKTILSDNAENTAKSAFDLKGFSVTDSLEYNPNYYLIEWRNGDNGLVDNGLNAINLSRPGLNFAPGMVVWYINEKYAGVKPDQNVADHPAEAFASVVDSDPTMIKYFNGDDPTPYNTGNMTNLMHDAAFSLREAPLDYVYNKTTHTVDMNTIVQPAFADSNSYENSVKPMNGVSLENLGLKAFIVEESANRSTVKIHIAKGDTVKPAADAENLVSSIKWNYKKLTVKSTDSAAVAGTVKLVGPLGDRDVKLTGTNGELTGDLGDIYDILGYYRVSCVVLQDKAGNAKAFYNADKNSGFGTDLKITY